MKVHLDMPLVFVIVCRTNHPAISSVCAPPRAQTLSSFAAAAPLGANVDTLIRIDAQASRPAMAGHVFNRFFFHDRKETDHDRLTMTAMKDTLEAAISLAGGNPKIPT